MSDENIIPGLDDDSASWHVLRLKNRLGPYRLPDLIYAISEGVIRSGDLVWHPTWRDWREVRLIAGRLSPSLVSIFDFEQFYSLDLNTERLPLAHKFELNLRPIKHKNSIEQLLRENHVPLIVNLLILAIIVSILAALSTLIFGNSRNGILCVWLEFIILCSICVRMFGGSAVIRISTFHFSTAPTIAALLLLAINAQRLPDAFDAWQGKKLASNLRTPKQVEHLAQDHPSNKFLALLAASHNIAEQSMAAVRQLIEDLQDPTLTLHAVLTASSRDQLNNQAQRLRAAEARTTLAWSDYLQILQVQSSKIEQAAREIYHADPLHLTPKFLLAYTSQQEKLREQMDKRLQIIAARLSAMGDLAEFAALHFDQKRIPRLAGAMNSFADQATNDQLKNMIASVRAAETKLAELDRQGQLFNVEENAFRDVIVRAM